MVDLTLDTKIRISSDVIEDALTQFKKPCIVWSGGKDSTVVLDLVINSCRKMQLPTPPVMFIDHGDHYKETYEMIDLYVNKWNLRLINARNEDFLSNIHDNKVKLSDLNEENRAEAKKVGFSGEIIEYSLETDVGNHLLKTVAMNRSIRKYDLEALFTGIRWDENEARGTERYFSIRANPEHFRIHPILHFKERDIWDYMFKFNLPIHPKYKEGYRSIDGIHDSKKISDIPAWEQDLELTKERAGRSQDKEGMMEKLRRLGYM